MLGIRSFMEDASCRTLQPILFPFQMRPNAGSNVFNVLLRGIKRLRRFVPSRESLSPAIIPGSDGLPRHRTHRPPVLKVVPLRITPSATGSVELTLPSGAMVRFPADISPELVVAILRGWEGPAC